MAKQYEYEITEVDPEDGYPELEQPGPEWRLVGTFTDEFLSTNTFADALFAIWEREMGGCCER